MPDDLALLTGPGAAALLAAALATVDQELLGWRVRSVDHGTAFDIAGSGIAREASLVLACRRAAQLAPGWETVWETARQGSSQLA